MNLPLEAVSGVLLSDSTALILESRHRIARIRESIQAHARHRRWKPIGGGAEADPAVRERIRQALADGGLPLVDGDRTWAGNGSGRVCRLCALTIEVAQVEHEVDLRETFVVHRECLMIWREESTRQRRKCG
jgi:hypothetical protein